MKPLYNVIIFLLLILAICYSPRLASATPVFVSQPTVVYSSIDVTIITWTTDVPSYGESFISPDDQWPTTRYPLYTSYGTEHVRWISGLTPLPCNLVYYYRVEAWEDGNGRITSNVSTFKNCIWDTDPPVISNISASNITDTGATINWETDEYSRGAVYFDTDSSIDPNYGNTIEEADYGFNHEIILTNLDPLTPYYFRVWAKDPENNDVFSDEFTFTTAADLPFSCSGFNPPFDKTLMLKKNVNRAIPLKIQLFYGTTLITDQNCPSPPVVEVDYHGETIGDGSGSTEELEPLGSADDGNTFRYDADCECWIFNLGTKQFSSPGIYEVRVEGGQGFSIYPTCFEQFERLD